MKLATYLLLFLYPLSLSAQTVLLKEGDTAPSDGWLITNEAAEKSFRLNEKFKLLEEKLQVKDQELLKKEEKIEIQDTTIKTLDKSLSDIKDQHASQQSNQIYINLGFLGLGIAATVAVVLVTGFALGAINREATSITK